MRVVVCAHQDNVRLALLDCPIIPHKSVCKIAKVVDDAKVIVEDGFDYVADIEDMKLFRKRK